MNQDIIERILADANKSIPAQQRALAAEFIAQYYQTVPTEDLQQRSPTELRAVALTHWQLGLTRKLGHALLRVYNPQPETHGWQSVHTIVEAVLDDRPFLVDSMRNAASRLGLTVHLTIHPVLHVNRNDKGEITAVNERANKNGVREAYLQLHVDKRSGEDELLALQKEFSSVLEDVQAATEDWPAMVAFAQDTTLKLSHFAEGRTGIQEAASFLQWLAEGHFTFLACCEFRTDGQNFKAQKDASLGLLRSKRKSGSFSAQNLVPSGSEEFASSDKALAVTKSNVRSTVHRDAKLDLITISLYDKAGKVEAKRCFLGLLTSAAYRHLTSDIPMLSARTARVVLNAGLPDGSHDQKALRDILETFPRDLIMQCDTDDLSDMAIGILGLQERQRVRLFGQRDRFGRFYNCLVYIPRDKYGRELRLAVQDVLSNALKGIEVEFDTQFSSNSALARINYVIWTDPSQDCSKLDWRALEQKIVDIAHGWDEQLCDAVRDHFGDEKGNTLLRKYEGAFASGYKSDYPAGNAAWDIARMEKILAPDDIGMRFFRPPLADEALVHFKLYAPDKPVILSDVLPVLENMGLRVEGENPHRIDTNEGKRYWLHEFMLRAADGSTIDPELHGERFMACFEGVWHGEVENDSFNRLVLAAGASWRDTVVIRALCKYMLQIRLPFSEKYIADSLCDNPEIARTLISLFQARFDPATNSTSAKQVEAIHLQLDKQLEGVASLDQDRILRSFRNLIEATLRTNHYQHNEAGEYKEYLSIKLDTAHIDGIPLPRPKYEIFVCSPRMEGVHLRGGSVARGGLRWSDRREDFRTEILGLVKAQMVKNAVIVPVGSKGGFILKRAPVSSDREAFMAEGIACYKTFLRGLLDITDNLVEGEVAPPKEVVRYDGDDPYLVVAADKGTATFSDYANSVSEEYGFWLGDAFASGGSNGYDHKGMGITARGAWESVKRHFRELGHNTQTTDFSVVGVGDMAGDVFGNGMLLSEHIQLVAAFNHMHIFIDPTPDSASSFKERERLFALPRSSWTDYNTSLISQGGGIFERSAKSIDLSPEIKTALDIKADKLTPNEL
ncbi:MAG: NAD-glutamate dehydrogenase, partial [Granulosicoccaceae bacterium]